MLKIAVIEDEYEIRTGLCRLITKLSPDYKIIGSAENGYEGMQLIKNFRPDLAICDIKMPNLNGLDMIDSLNELGIDCQYVILSGHSEFSYAQQAIRLNICDYLLKPVSIEELERILLDVKKRLAPDTPNQPEQIHYSYLIQLMLEKINSQYFDKLSLTDIARELGVTPEYLSSLFTKETGNNFTNYLKEVRVKKACELLNTTSKKVYEIAFKVGYDDPQYFCRVFKEITGVTPKTYVRNHQE